MTKYRVLDAQQDVLRVIEADSYYIENGYFVFQDAEGSKVLSVYADRVFMIEVEPK